jgi:hypothetical protein
LPIFIFGGFTDGGGVDVGFGATGTVVGGGVTGFVEAGLLFGCAFNSTLGAGGVIVFSGGILFALLVPLALSLPNSL